VQKWRLLPLIEASGQIQMAIDRWLLQQHQQGNHPPCLRFYTWSPVAISLGYHQRHYPDRWNELQWQGQKIDLVRRPTGGRAVLHQGDLTYMVVTSGLRGSRMQVYEAICQFLIAGWRSLGLELYYGQAGRGYIHNPNCFGTATQADLIDCNGNKRIGSAQLKRGDMILQHGSMVLYPDSDLFEQVFQEEAPPTLNLSSSLFLNQIINALTQAASEHFQVEWELQPLSTEEWGSIKKRINLRS
jgi:lipoate---protein ligase